jgi:L-lactate dehydrogenase complex protein LldF
VKIDIDAPYRTRVRQALADADLKSALDLATSQLAARRLTALAAVDAELMRSEGRAVRERAIRRLPELLEEFEGNLIRNGCSVHWARDAVEANDAVIEIARNSGVARAVKSKSMLTEEIGLNEALEEAGIEVVETDLGEYIIQLDDEPPSHLVAPVIHKRAVDVSRVFERELGMEPTLDAAVMCGVARKELRRRFLEADMGISGCNFAVAESGTVCLITNEGNGRMVTSLPPVYVVVVGIEKVVETVEDAVLLWQAATRNATGQDASVYFSLTSGPQSAGQPDGPREMHVVLVDNGRSGVVKRQYADALLCIRCGACLDVCPVYREIGGHAYGRTAYSGPIGAILTPLLSEACGGPVEGTDLPFASTLCGACKDACPVKIDLPRLLLELRADLAEGGESSLAAKVSVKALTLPLHTPRRYRFATRVARLFGRLLGRRIGHLTALPPPFAAWTRTRVFPLPPKRTFRELWKSRDRPDDGGGAAE